MRARVSLLFSLASLLCLAACDDAEPVEPLPIDETHDPAGPDSSDPIVPDASIADAAQGDIARPPMDAAPPITPMDATLDGSLPAMDAAPETSVASDDASFDGGTDIQIDPACQQCLTDSCSDNAMVGDLARHCATLPGVATGGPALGRPLADLCLDLVSCAREHDCGRPQLEGCMCGDLDRTACLRDFASARGPCLAPTLAAAQTADVRRFAGTFRNPTFALGAAMLLIACEIEHCAAACGRSE